MNIYSKNIIITFFLLSITFFAQSIAAETTDANPAKLSLKEFIQLATKNDITFETILIDRLALQYRRQILLPDDDVIMDVKYQHNFYLSQDKNKPEASLSLNKLFPYNGTQVSLTYNKSATALDIEDDSSLQFLLSQPIAKNAFGKSIELQDKIVGIENDVQRYQIIEAYEDYLASLTVAYYNWYSAYENLKVGKSSYRSTQELMANIHERQRQKIALPIDVNKIKLLLIGKNENLIVLEEIYQNYSNLIFKSINYNGSTPYIPEKPERPAAKVEFDTDYTNFTQNSRTYNTLHLLEQQGNLEVKKAADDLLPSTNLLLGYQIDGKEWGIREQKDNFFAGIELSWPIGRNISKAKSKLAKISQKKTALSNQNKYAELYTNLKNIYLQVNREEKLISIAQKKIALAESILKDEAENYSYGKVTLNDYIAAVNLVDENRFSHTEHSVQLNKLLVEWLRLTDQLVDNKVID